MFGNPENFPHKSVSIDYCWFQEQKKGMFHVPHVHGFGGLSAVCFMDFDSNDQQLI